MPATSRRVSPRLTKAEYGLLAAFRYRLRRFLQFSEEAAQTAGLTPRQYQALLAIKGFPRRERETIGEACEPVTFATTLLGSSRRRRGRRSRQMLGQRKAPSPAPPNISFHMT